MLPNRVPTNASELLSVIEKRLSRLELKGRGFVVPESIMSYSQDEQPTGVIQEGSIWIDTNLGNAIYRYTAGVWVVALDPMVDKVRDEAAIAIVDAQSQASYTDNRVILYFQASEPPPGAPGDLWVNAGTNLLYESSGAQWVSLGTTTLGLSIVRASNLSSLADTQVITWWQFNPPTAVGIGDLWVDTSNSLNVLYRWTNFTWQQVTGWTTPLYDALGAKISSFSQDTPPVATAVGDIWFDTSNGNLAYRATDVVPTVAVAAIVPVTETGTPALAPRALRAGAVGDPVPVPDPVSTPALTVSPSGLVWAEVPAGTGAISDAAIDTTKIAPQAVTATSLESDLLLSSNISTGHIDRNVASPTFGKIVGQRVEITPYGIRLVDVNGQDIVSLSVDLDQPATFDGQITTRALRVLGGTSIEEEGNQIASGGVLELSQGQKSPNVGPILSIYYETTELDHTTEATSTLGTFSFLPSAVTAFAFDNQYGDGWIVAQRRPDGTRIWRFTLEGALKRNGDGTPAVTDMSGWTLTGISTRTGSAAIDYIGTQDGLTYYLVGQVQFSPATTQRNVVARTASAGPPTLGYDVSSAAYIISELDTTTDQVRIRRVFVTSTPDGSLSSTDPMISSSAGTGLVGPLLSGIYGSFDFGTPRYIFATQAGSGSTFITNESGTVTSAERFPMAVPNPIGFAWDGDQFCTLSPSGTLYKHSTWTWTDVNTKLFAGVTYYDSDVAGSGTHETTLGKVTGITRQKRSNVLCTLPPVPDKGNADDPDRWRLYAAVTPSLPPTVLDTYRLQATGVGSSPSVSGTFLLNNVNTASASPPTVNNFPSSGPARLVSANLDTAGNPLISLAGDGSGRMGPYSWGAGEVDTGWVDIPPAAGFTVSGFSRCRRVGKIVEVEIFSIVSSTAITIDGFGTSPDTTIALVPEGFRPPSSVRGAGWAMRGAWFILSTTGDVRLHGADGNGTSWDIPAGEAFSCHFMYFMP